MCLFLAQFAGYVFFWGGIQGGGGHGLMPSQTPLLVDSRLQKTKVKTGLIPFIYFYFAFTFKCTVLNLVFSCFL